MGAEGAGHPFNDAALLHQRPLGVQVVHVLRPVFDGGVPELGPFLHIQLHTAGVEVGHVVLGGGAALDKVQTGALVHDDEGMLELSRALGVETEVGLQRDGQVDALGHVHKGAA